MSNLPKRHHFVPECYLTNFIKSSTLYVLDIRKVQKGFKENIQFLQPAGICYLEYYYLIKPSFQTGTFKLDPPHELFIEIDVLHSYENKYGGIFTEITQNKSISYTTALMMCDFLILLKLRNPFHLTHIVEKKTHEWIGIAINSILKDKQADERFDAIPLDLKLLVGQKIQEETLRNPETPKKIFLNSLASRGTDPAKRNRIFRDALMKCTWSLLIAPEGGPYFITTDNPGIAVGEDNKFYNTKFENGFTFYLPLSYRHCLVITDTVLENNHSDDSLEKHIKHLPVNKEIVFRVNDSLIQKVNKLLIASEPSYLEEIARLNAPKK